MEHNCINKEVIEQLRERIRHLETKSEVLETNVNTVKEDIKDMKVSIKEVSTKMDTMNHTNIAILVSVILLLLGVVVNLFVKWGIDYE